MATILVVDDYPVTQRVLSHILRKDGHTVVIAANGREGLERLEAEGAAFDLAILDIAMPEMDGLTMLRRVRAQERFQA